MYKGQGHNAIASGAMWKDFIYLVCMQIWSLDLLWFKSYGRG